MGSCHPERYSQDPWSKIYPNVRRNLDTYEEMEVHQHEFDPQEQQEFTTAYQLRRTTVPPFVRVLDYDFSHGMLGAHTAIAYTQRIFRLNGLELSIPEAIHMLRECVTAFGLLFEEYGPFEIREGMIGVNQKGRVKVWISQNFSENDIRDPGNIPDYITEQDIVLDLAQLIQRQLDADHLSAFLLPYQGRLNFQNALRIIETVQAKDLVRVNRIFLDEEEYNRYLSKQLMASGLASTNQASSSNQVTTTTTTTTTTTQMVPQVVPQPQQLMVMPNYNQMSRMVLMPEPQYAYDIAYVAPQQFPLMQPTGSAQTASYTYAAPQPPPLIPKQLAPYQKFNQQNVKPRKQHAVRLQNPQQQNEYIRPINRAPRQPNLKRVMPTTQKNWKERELQLQHRQKFKEIPMVESRIVKAPH